MMKTIKFYIMAMLGLLFFRCEPSHTDLYNNCRPAPALCTPPMAKSSTYKLSLQGGTIDIEFQRSDFDSRESFYGTLKQSQVSAEIPVTGFIDNVNPILRVFVPKSDLGNFSPGPATLNLIYKVSYGPGKDQSVPLAPISVELVP